MSLIITVYFEHEDRGRVVNAVLLHDDLAFALAHVYPEEGSEFILFKLRDNTNMRLRKRLNQIRNEGSCRIDKKVIPDGKLKKFMGAFRPNMDKSYDPAGRAAVEILRELGEHIKDLQPS